MMQCICLKAVLDKAAQVALCCAGGHTIHCLTMLL